MSTRQFSSTKQAALERLLRGEGALRKPDTIALRPAGAVVPISAEQEHIWLHAAMAPDVPLYNEAITIHRRGACDPALLAASFNEVLRRHEIWRTDFQLGSEGIMQRVHDGLALHLPVTDLTGLPAPERQAAALRIATEDARLPFDLSQAPLLRGWIAKLSKTDHRLYITLHHIIFDGVSIYRLLVPSLAAIYADLAAGRAVAKGEEASTVQYGDYTLWRQEQLQTSAVARQLAYWTRTLAGELPVLRLPGDRPPPPVPSHRGGMETFALSAALTQGVKRASLDLGITPYGLLLTAFGTLLFRYTGQTDLIVGGVMDMRGHRALEPVIGYFLNSLPIRTKPTPGMPFRDYAKQTSDAVLGMLDNCNVPFSQLVRAMKPRREGATHPLFQVLFSIEPPAPDFAEGWDLTQMDVPVYAAKYDLYLELDERPEGMIGRFLYSTDLFESATIRRMIGHWLGILEAAIAEPDCPLERLQLLTPEETAEMAAWNDTARPMPEASVHTLFEMQARRTPNAEAVVSAAQRCTYAELDAQASGIAAWLRAEGVAPGSLVAVCIDRSVEAVGALLGIMKAGAAYMPLDPMQPPSRIAHCLEEAAADILLTTADRRAVIPNASARVLLLEEAGGTSCDAATVPSGPDDLAYVLCTSGTTGKPKAVEITHRALVNLLMATCCEIGFSAKDSLLAVTTFSFDIAALELFLPLLNGGRVTLASREAAADPVLLAELLGRSRPTVMQATPSTWRALVDAGWEGLPGLKLLTGGEALPRELADALLRRADSVWNMYGPTETTIWSTIHRVQVGQGAVSIGRPIGNTTAFVVDAQGNQLPVGVPGELCLGGAGLARGYSNRPALTRARFITLQGTQGQRVYRTGDIARFNADGTLEWLGRDDDQVKIRGHRIALAEIEAQLEIHPAISAAIVKPYAEANGALGLAAYVVARTEPAPAAAELRRFLCQCLPSYMLPSRYLPLPALPLTPNGKRDRNALPDPALQAALTPAVPQSSRVEQLAAIYGDLLGGAVSAGDNFFDLGGHSLLAARLMHRIELAFGRRLPLAAVFEAPTVAELAARIDAVQPMSVQPKDAETRKLMSLFESLGDDCEFGLAQRRYGAEMPGLLRFTSIALENLLAGLAAAFVGIDEPEALCVVPGTASGAYIVQNARYQCGYQAIAEQGSSVELVLAREVRKLRALRPMLIRNLERGSRICVFKSRDGMKVKQARQLSAALRRYGPTTLLWVRLADEAHPPGSVEWLSDHLMAGWMDRFAPAADPATSSDVWLTLCRRAHELWRSFQSGAA